MAVLRARTLQYVLGVGFSAFVVLQLLRRFCGCTRGREDEDDEDDDDDDPTTRSLDSMQALRRKRRLYRLEKENESRESLSSSFSSSFGHTPAAASSSTAAAWTALGLEQHWVIATVGLPARGKSFISKMLIRYLHWTGFECEVFNVGSKRRNIGLQSADSSFFDMKNETAKQIREQMAMEVQDEMYAWLHESASKRRVAIFDATNTTQHRRQALANRARRENVYLLFVESICDDQLVLRRNYELKLQNEDYKSMDRSKALEDFLARVVAYERVYETIIDSEDSANISYIKLINVGQKVITRNCSGYLPSQISFYLQNIHINPRKIYLTLPAESDRRDADSGEDTGSITAEGRVFTLNLVKFIQAEQEAAEAGMGREILVLTGTSKEQAETVTHLRILYSVYCTQLLNELRGGDLHGLSKDEIKKRYPIEYERRVRDKLNYRYPGAGESYLDVIERVRPIIVELERQRKSVVLVCHPAVLRTIYAYFMGCPLADLPFIPLKRHIVYELEVGAFGCKIRGLDVAD
jgi:broad specificity phosphatase PhoE/predicted kinase